MQDYTSPNLLWAHRLSLLYCKQDLSVGFITVGIMAADSQNVSIGY